MSAQIPLWHGGQIVASALVDEEDYDLLDGWVWRVITVHRQSNEWGYAFRATPGGGTLNMHREVMGLGYGDPGIVHHLNRLKRDNRRENLVICMDAGAHAQGYHGSRAQRSPFWCDDFFEVAA